jgi:hypothetical protein
MEAITEMVAVCHYEPRGECGLEGYQRGESYRCEMVKPAGPHPRYYRVYPDKAGDYYECAVPRQFTKYFTVEEKVS